MNESVMAQVCIVFAEEVELAERVAELPVTILYLVLSKLEKKLSLANDANNNNWILTSLLCVVL